MFWSNEYNVSFSAKISGRGTQLVQKKRTLYPEWNTCFDAHLNHGRVIQMVLMERPNTSLADVSIGAKILADKCADGNATRTWVKKNLSVSVSLFHVPGKNFP